MKRKGKESKLNVALTALLVVFVCLLAFSIGVISGKGWSDREYKVRHIENDSHLKVALADNEPLGDEMTSKEVELLTKRALEEARAEQPNMDVATNKTNLKRDVASDKHRIITSGMSGDGDPKPDPRPRKRLKDDLRDNDDEKPDKRPTDDDGGEKFDSYGSASSAANHRQEIEGRKVSSLMPKPSTPKPTSIEYTVQVAAYKTLHEAEIHSQKLIDKGFPAFPVKAMIKGKAWYRVSIGSFKNRKQAMK